MGQCKQCGGVVRWEKKSGRWFCFNADGSDHWDECAKRRWEKISTEGQHFEHGTEKGYEHDELGTKYYQKSSGWKRGAQYKPTGLCRQCVPPWETCAGCPDQFAEA
jgi:hypothetical protein